MQVPLGLLRRQELDPAPRPGIMRGSESEQVGRFAHRRITFSSVASSASYGAHLTFCKRERTANAAEIC
jgi:hypothetical protein